MSWLNELERLRKEHTELTEERAKLIADKGHLNGVCEERGRRINELEARLARTCDERDAIDSEKLTAEQERSKQLGHRVEDLERRLASVDQRRETAEKNLARKIRDETSVPALRQELADTRARVAEFRQKSEEAEARLAVVRQDKKDMEKARNEKNDEAIRLRKELEFERGQLRLVREDRDFKMEQCASMRKHLDSLGKGGDLEGQLDLAHNQIRNLEESLNEARRMANVLFV